MNLALPHPYAALAAALLLAAPVAAQEIDLDPEDPVQARPVPWHHGFALTSSGGVTNPGVLVGFNPQPEPPARIAELSFAYPPDPILILRDQQNPAAGHQLFDLFVAVGVPGVPLNFTTPAIDPATPSLSTVFTSARTDAGVTVLTFYLDISSSSGGILSPATLVGFNPQPEPPAGYDSGVFGVTFGINALSDAMVRVRIHDSTGSPLLLSPVPEPRGLLAVGLLALAALRWWNQRRALSTHAGV